MSEAVMEAVADAYDELIHLFFNRLPPYLSLFGTLLFF
jgi:hypothetical protein